MANNTLNLSTIKTEEIFKALTTQQRDEIFRKVYFEHVREDVEGRLMEKPGIDVPEGKEHDICKKAANAYVYEGDYDCNLSYRDNIDNLIAKFVKEGK